MMIKLVGRGATVYTGARSEVKATATVLEIRKELLEADITFVISIL